MKTIKFRAWEESKKKMHYDVSMPCNDEGIDVNPWVPMQFTGLKDKNGKEIYEGDILLHKYYFSPEMSTSYYEEEDKIVVKIPDFYYFLGSDAVQNSDENIEEFVSHMEIIGNIYENPELS